MSYSAERRQTLYTRKALEMLQIITVPKGIEAYAEKLQFIKDHSIDGSTRGITSLAHGALILDRLLKQDPEVAGLVVGVPNLDESRVHPLSQFKIRIGFPPKGNGDEGLDISMQVDELAQVYGVIKGREYNAYTLYREITDAISRGIIKTKPTEESLKVYPFRLIDESRQLGEIVRRAEIDGTEEVEFPGGGRVYSRKELVTLQNDLLIDLVALAPHINRSVGESRRTKKRKVKVSLDPKNHEVVMIDILNSGSSSNFDNPIHEIHAEIEGSTLTYDQSNRLVTALAVLDQQENS